MEEVNNLKLLLGRASILLVFALLLVFGLFIFTAKYVGNASTWAHYPTNQHLYTEGKLVSCGTIYDRRGSILCQMEGGEVKFHTDKAVRTAVMHATGDLYDNVMTGARVAFRDRLSGWDMINGVYNFRKQEGGGRDLSLNLDADLCTVAYGELGGRKGTVHGPVDLEKALACSCNVAFAQIASELGAGTLQEFADAVGFNTSLDVDGIKTAVGMFDVSGAVGADLAWSGIGQYTNTANPLNIMAYMGAIANDGVRITPRIVKSKGIFSLINLPAVEKKRILSSETARRLGGMMRNNTISQYGEDNFRGLELCAKSGTAQVDGDKKPHAWFSGYLDREDYPLAFVVVIENGGSGTSAAGPVAAKVLQAAVHD